MIESEAAARAYVETIGDQAAIERLDWLAAALRQEIGALETMDQLRAIAEKVIKASVTN